MVAITAQTAARTESHLFMRLFLAAVAASTHDRTLSATFSVSGSDFVGAAVHRVGVGPAAVVLAVAAATEGANLTEANLCYEGTLNASLVAGTIVVSLQV
jgi:hypothetical protein